MTCIYKNLLFSFKQADTKFFCSFKPTVTVQNYNPATDSKAVCEIALQNLSKLVSLTPPDYSKDRLELFKSMIQPSLESLDFNKKVLCLDNKAIGFVTYQTENCWHGTYAKIEHLAVNNAHQNKGYGTALLKNVLEELKKDKVEFVCLDITDDDLVKFYSKYNFKVLKPVNIKYGHAGHMAQNLKENKGNLAVKSLDFLRMRRNLLPNYAFGLFLVSALFFLMNKDKKDRS